jgi:hypothetical protein
MKKLINKTVQVNVILTIIALLLLNASILILGIQLKESRKQLNTAETELANYKLLYKISE